MISANKYELEGTDISLISSYINGTLRSDDSVKVEKWIKNSDKVNQIYTEKLEAKKFLLELVPQKNISAVNKKNILEKIAEVNENMPLQKENSLPKKIYNFLFTPIVEL